MPRYHEFAGLALALLILAGIRLMNSPKTAVTGNRLSAVCMAIGIGFTLWSNDLLDLPLLVISLALGALVGALWALRTTALRTPQMVALLNGLGGGASALTAFVVMVERNGPPDITRFTVGILALAVGGVTFGGSAVAAAKLDGLLPQKSVRIRGHRLIVPTAAASVVLFALIGLPHFGGHPAVCSLLVMASSLAFGILFALPVGGADMPITISLLNSLSGLAASICGFAVDDVLLVSVGAIVGAAGLILTQTMCAAMNRSLLQVLAGASSAATTTTNDAPSVSQAPPVPSPACNPAQVLRDARKVIIVPGYGMALAQAQHRLRDLYDILERQGKDTAFAIHPVAGRMPGHMTVLLAEVDIPYDKMLQMEEINPEFPKADVALVVGACDVVNPAAITAEGTPIYGMPILNVHEAAHVIVCNMDAKPGYSGVENPLYRRANVAFLPGDAAATLAQLAQDLART